MCFYRQILWLSRIGGQPEGLELQKKHQLIARMANAKYLSLTIHDETADMPFLYTADETSMYFYLFSMYFY